MLGDYIDVTEGIDNPLLYAFVPYAACCAQRWRRSVSEGTVTNELNLLIGSILEPI